MSELIACMIVYNESKLLPRCLESLAGKVDRLIIVEGRIATYPGEQIHSDDGTLQILSDSSAEIIQSDNAWESEVDMRNQYLLGNEGDWYFIIDADEELTTPLPYPDELPDNPISYAIELRMLHKYNEVIYPPRLFRHTGGMQYRDIHHALYSNDTLISHPKNTKVLPSVKMVHNQLLREKERWKDKKIKRAGTYAREKLHRRRLGL